MKKSIILISLLFLFLAIAWLGFRGFSRQSEKNKLSEKQKNLTFFLSTFGLSINARQPSIIVYFNSECEFCHWQMKHIADNLHLISECNLFLFSHEELEDAKSYLKQIELEKYFVEAPPATVLNAFNTGIPQIFIFKEGVLKKHNKGEVTVQEMMKYLTD